MVKQVKDDSGAIIPLLGYKLGGAHQLAYTAGSANTINISTQVISVTPTTNCFIEIGATATSSSHFLLGGSCYDLTIGAENRSANVSVIGASASGILYISERL